MKFLSVILLVTLAGCSTSVPVKRTFPAVPQSLTVSCPELTKIEKDNVSIVDLHTAVVENYAQYYECALKVDTWNLWYNEQKKIFNEVK